MEIEWELSYTSTVRRGYVVDLFRAKGLLDDFSRAHWPAGLTDWGKRECERVLRIKARYEAFLAGNEVGTRSQESETNEGHEFAAESDLRDFLARNLSLIEPGLRLYSVEGRKGVEFSIDDGRIDILAIDAKARFVVIELKLSMGRNKALGQLLYYMGWVDQHLGNTPSRGVIVAREISEDLATAVRRIPDISLFHYHLSMTLEKVTP